MAQRTEKEETEFKIIPESITPCINNCGVTVNPSINDMCQKCFSTSTSPKTSSTSTVTANSVFQLKSLRPSSPRSSPSVKLPDPANVKETVEMKREVNRCSGCRRKVGLTGFRCRCGEIFCSLHRYSDRHDCSYDYKSVGREVIARENPVVKAAKIVRI